jgi:hypothetical protein
MIMVLPNECSGKRDHVPSVALNNYPDAGSGETVNILNSLNVYLVCRMDFESGWEPTRPV